MMQSLWLRIIAWAAWQLFVLLFAFIVYANLFGEYGRYPHPALAPPVAVVFLVAALYVGTVVPLQRWRAAGR